MAAAAVAHEAESACLPRAKGIDPVLGDEIVLPVPEEGEVSAVQPLEQFPGLVQVRDAGCTLRRRKGSLDAPDLAAHRRPVLDGGADVREDAVQSLHDGGPLGIVGDLADLHRYPGLDGGALVSKGHIPGDVRQGRGITA